MVEGALDSNVKGQNFSSLMGMEKRLQSLRWPEPFLSRHFPRGLWTRHTYSTALYEAMELSLGKGYILMGEDGAQSKGCGQHDLGFRTSCP